MGGKNFCEHFGDANLKREKAENCLSAFPPAVKAAASKNVTREAETHVFTRELETEPICIENSSEFTAGAPLKVCFDPPSV